MKRRLLLALLSGALVLLGAATTVAAAMPTSVYWPDTTGPSVTSADAYRDYLVSGDVLVIANYVAKYSVAREPSVAIDETFVGALAPSGGGDLLSTVAPYPYYNSGYASGVFAMYFQPGSTPTWEGSYAVKLFGSPTGYNWLKTTAATEVAGYEYYSGTYTDQTAAANNATANDMSLAYAAVSNASYFAGLQPYGVLTINIGTAGAGTWTITWEYYNGTWAALSAVVDGTSNFRADAGNHNVTFTMPTDWTETTVNSVTGYWTRARVSAYTSYSTAPLGTQSWVNSNNSPPSASSTTITWHNTSTKAATDFLVGQNVISWATALSAEWSVALTTTGVGGTVLSAYGEQYFGSAILGLAQACSNIYPAGLTVPSINVTYQPPTPTTTLEEDSPIDTTGISGWLLGGHDTAFRAVLFLVVWGGLLVLPIGAATHRFDLAIFVALPAVPISAALGGLHIAIVIVLTVLVVFAVLFQVIIQRGAT